VAVRLSWSRICSTANDFPLSGGPNTASESGRRGSGRRPRLLPPEVPRERVQALRRAFDATVNDPQFRDEAKRMGFDITLRTGEELQALVQAAKETPAEIIERVAKLVQAPAN
jgi:tripartite-type tricarboxylate transporter receptor subunit TctC